jgi:hypothetical protein
VLTAAQARRVQCRCIHLSRFSRRDVERMTVTYSVYHPGGAVDEMLWRRVEALTTRLGIE